MNRPWPEMSLYQSKANISGEFGWPGRFHFLILWTAVGVLWWKMMILLERVAFTSAGRGQLDPVFTFSQRPTDPV